MITFVSLFLGLVFGVRPVEVVVSGAVVTVELRLDGKPVGVIRQAPWTTEFSNHYRIHRALKETAGGNVAEPMRGDPVPHDFHYSSNENDQWLTAHDLTELLKTIP